MRLNVKALVAVLCAVPALAFGESAANVNPSTSTSTATVSAVSTVYGRVELRPTWGTSLGIIDAQNNAEIGYTFTPDTKVLFNQSFNFDISNRFNKDVNFLLPDSRIEADFNNIWADRRAGRTLDYQPRLHIPTDTTKRDLGLITEFRHQFNLNQTLSDSFAVTASVIPAFHAYTKRGGVAAGVATANPLFENRLEVVAKWQLARKWKLEVPLKFWQTRYSEFQAGAVNNDAWAFSVTTKPELMWAFDPKVSVGVAVEPGSFFSSNLKYETTSAAFKATKAQFALIATL